MKEPLETFENCLTLWLPNSPDLDSDLIKSLSKCNHALNELMDFQISFQEYLDILSRENINIDNYLEISHDNIIANGL